MSTVREVRCIELVESVTEWMEGALADEDRLLDEAHLATCASCAAYVAPLRVALALLSRQRQAGPPARSAPLLDVVRAALLPARQPPARARWVRPAGPAHRLGQRMRHDVSDSLTQASRGGGPRGAGRGGRAEGGDGAGPTVTAWTGRTR